MQIIPRHRAEALLLDRFLGRVAHVARLRRALGHLLQGEAELEEAALLLRAARLAPEADLRARARLLLGRLRRVAVAGEPSRTPQQLRARRPAEHLVVRIAHAAARHFAVRRLERPHRRSRLLRLHGAGLAGANRRLDPARQQHLHRRREQPRRFFVADRARRQRAHEVVVLRPIFLLLGAGDLEEGRRVERPRLGARRLDERAHRALRFRVLQRVRSERERVHRRRLVIPEGEERARHVRLQRALGDRRRR